MKILLALSGGIDSSVVAHLLKEQGHEVIGVRFTLWTDPLAPAMAQVLPSKCCTTQNIARADKVAKKLGIKLHIVDLTEEFKKSVVDPFLDGYSKGFTPNPCIGCNRNIKFGKLLTIMKELGCERLATGHYARIAVEYLSSAAASSRSLQKKNELSWFDSAHHDNLGFERHLLLEATDKKKDQSYYLYGLTQEQLKHVMFPLGTMQKSHVYGLAEHFQIPLPDEYIESQDLCFFPEKTPQAFLKRHLKDSLKPGNITRRDGTIVGTHEGLPLYTVGQRRGLKIGGLKIPLEVVEKDAESNQLIVDEKDRSKISEIQLHDMRFVSWIPSVDEPQQFDCRLRSLSARKRGALQLSSDGQSGTFLFSSHQSPQAPGQSLVLYRGEEVVGGGVMT